MDNINLLATCSPSCYMLKEAQEAVLHICFSKVLRVARWYSQLLALYLNCS